MREILFRGKVASEVLSGNEKKDGVWVYGFYSPAIWYPSLEQRPSIKTFSGSDIEIDPNTLGQYTGLKDVNGTKIFESDIVLVSGVAKAKIIWNAEDACFAFDYGADGRPLMLDFVNDTSIEVIGNIHDNPELLKGVQE